jgi:hypothetical protein
LDSQVDASSGSDDSTGDLLPPSRALVPAPVGAAADSVRVWFDAAVEASEPVVDGTLASERDAADIYRRLAKPQTPAAPTGLPSEPGAPGAPGMTSLPCPPPARMSPPFSPASAAANFPPKP